MSFVNRLLGIGSRSSGPDNTGSGEVADDNFDYSAIDNCPYCQRGLQGWGCVACNVEFVLEDNTRLVEREPSPRESSSQRQCVRCDRSMTGGEFIAAWEDGSNADAYTACPRCGYQNLF